MSLLTDSLEAFTMIDKTTVSDGYGGFSVEWVEGAEFIAAAVYDTSIEARVAGVQGVTSLYTVTTQRNVTLVYHDIIRRESDGKILRVTSDGTDKKTPPTAGLDMRQVTAEEYKLTGEIQHGQSTSTT